MTLAEPVVVAVGPPEVSGKWGFFQFPNLWRGRDGLLYLAVNIGADSEAGHHEPSACCESKDGGQSWAAVTPDELDLAPRVYALPDGGEIAFGGPRKISHFKKGDGYVQETPTVSELGLKPVIGPVRGSYEVNEYAFFRLGDIPESVRDFPASARPSAGAEWQQQSCTIKEPELLTSVLMRAGWWDDQGQFEWEDQDQAIVAPAPHKPDVVEVLPDGTLLWALSTQNPDVRERGCWIVSCLASSDHGRTWALRGQRANATTGSSHGYGFGEQALARLPDGDLLCLMRTTRSGNIEHSNYLAAARSKDDGHTWAQVQELAPFSVTPHLAVLANGCAAAIYGRPGVHVRTSSDSGETWSDPTAIVGPPESFFMETERETWWEGRHDYSCCNTTLVVTGPDRFLLAYSDFQHADADGNMCKAIKVREISCPA